MEPGEGRIGAVLAPAQPQDRAAQPTSEFVYRRLCDAIQSGFYPPFTRLVQEQIADQLNVSRTPVRDALTRLANDEIVLWTPGRGGYVVPDVTPDHVRQVHHVRRALECQGVEEAAPKYSASDIHLLGQLHQEALSADPAHSDYFAMNCRFHLALVEPGGNRLLTRLLNQLWQLPAARRIANCYLGSAEQERRSRTEHTKLIAAAESHDVTALVSLLAAHIDESYKFVEAALTYTRGDGDHSPKM